MQMHRDFYLAADDLASKESGGDNIGRFGYII